MSDFLAPGTKIRFRGQDFTVTKTNPKNYRIVDANGTEFNLNHNAPIEVLEKPSYTALVRKVETRFYPGEIVKVSRPEMLRSSKFKYAADQAFVVLKENPTTVKIAKLGGERGLSWTLTPSLLERVTVD